MCDLLVALNCFCKKVSQMSGKVLKMPHSEVNHMSLTCLFYFLLSHEYSYSVL